MFSKLISLRRAAAALMLAATLTPAAFAGDDVRAFAPQSAWQTISSTPGRFRVAMPGHPSYDHKTLSSESGPVDYHCYIFDAGNTAYGVSYSVYTTTNIDLDACVDGLATGFAGGRVLTSRRIAYGPYSGREATFAGDGGVFAKARVFAVGNRLYQTVVLTQGVQPATLPIAEFLDSFELTA